MRYDTERAKELLHRLAANRVKLALADKEIACKGLVSAFEFDYALRKEEIPAPKDVPERLVWMAEISRQILPSYQRFMKRELKKRIRSPFS